MRRLLILFIIIAVLGLSIIATYDNYVYRNNQNKVDIRGKVINSTVYGNIAIISVENEKTKQKATVMVDQSTSIVQVYRNYATDTSQINVGDEVEITFKGRVSFDSPVNASAKVVRIFE